MNLNLQKGEISKVEKTNVLLTVLFSSHLIILICPPQRLVKDRMKEHAFYYPWCPEIIMNFIDKMALGFFFPFFISTLAVRHFVI